MQFWLKDEDQSGNADVEFKEEIKPEALIIFPKYLRDYVIKMASSRFSIFPRHRYGTSG